MVESDPFAGLGKALARLRLRAGFSTQLEAAETLKVDKGQLSRWEHDTPRPTLESLGRVLAGYDATVADLAVELGQVLAEERRPTDEELIRSLTEAIQRVEGRQAETEVRVERLEKDWERAAG